MMKTFYPLVLIGLLWTGCSTHTPGINEYTILPHPLTSEQNERFSTPSTLRIASIKALPSLSSKNLYYLYDGGESGHYLYSRWSDTPSALIERSLDASLEEKKLFKSFFRSSSTVQSDYILESELNAFYHRLKKDDTSEGYIDITFHLIDATTRRAVASKHFALTAPAPSNDAKGAVQALSEATQMVSEQCTQWLTLSLKEKK